MKEIILLLVVVGFGLTACGLKSQTHSRSNDYLVAELQDTAETAATPTAESALDISFGFSPAHTSIPIVHHFQLPLFYELSHLDAVHRARLDELGRMLQGDSTLKVAIGAHTWNIGDQYKNLILSKRCAEAIKLYLSSRYDILPNRILANGYGSDRPASSNATPEGRRMNRRIDIIVTGQPAASIPTMTDAVADEVQTVMLTYPLGQIELPQEDMEVLEEVARTIASLPDAKVLIEGHTDDIGNEERNMIISQQRADTVKDYLFNQYGLTLYRIQAVGYGQQRPIADNATAEGRNKNRRVVVTVTSDLNASLPSAKEMVAIETQAKDEPEQQSEKQQDIARVWPEKNDTLKTVPEDTSMVPPDSPGRAIVLCYHRFDSSQKLSITSEDLERQIQFMLENGYSIISIETLASYLEKGQAIPDKSVVISIDDGWKSAMNGFKVFKKYDLPFTLFLSAKYIGYEGTQCLSQSDIDELKQYPKVTFGNHSYSHSNRLALQRYSDSDTYREYVKKDIAASIARFRDIVGHDTPFFAYPFGVYNETYIHELKKAGFKYLFTVGCKLATKDVDPTLIPRFGGHDMKMTSMAALFDSPSDRHLARRKGSRFATSATSGDETARPIISSEKTPAPDKEQSGIDSPPAQQKTPTQATEAEQTDAPQATTPVSSVEQSDGKETTHSLTDDPASSRDEAKVDAVDIDPASAAQTEQPAPRSRSFPEKYQTEKQTDIEASTQQQLAPKARLQDRPGLTVTAVGDVMMGTTYPTSMLPPDDGARIFHSIQDHLAGSDLVFGNLEGPLTESITPTKCGEGSRNCYEFRTPPRYVAYLKQAGFNVMSIANNHANDFGSEGVSSTVNALQSKGIVPVGGDYVGYFSLKGKTVAILGFAHNQKKSSHSIVDVQRATELVRRLKASNDLVFVSFHGGAEGQGAAEVADKTEIFCQENRGNVVNFAHSVIDAGADLVLGHGPHVLRAMEVYKGKLIAYSLGNFLVYEAFSTQGLCGQSVILKATLDPDSGNFLSGELVPVRLAANGLPAIDASQASLRQIRQLTLRNIPDTPLRIEDDGRLVADEASTQGNKVASRDETE